MVLVFVVLVAVVEVVEEAAFSALVSFGGVMSGVDFGTGLEALPPPQAASPNTQRSAALASVASRRRVTAAPLRPSRTADPCACRTSGSR